jgi:hypothetical protein
MNNFEMFSASICWALFSPPFLHHQVVVVISIFCSQVLNNNKFACVKQAELLLTAALLLFNLFQYDHVVWQSRQITTILADHCVMFSAASCCFLRLKVSNVRSLEWNFHN